MMSFSLKILAFVSLETVITTWIYKVLRNNLPSVFICNLSTPRIYEPWAPTLSREIMINIWRSKMASF